MLLHTFINFNDLGQKFDVGEVNLEKWGCCHFEEQLAEMVRINRISTTHLVIKNDT